MAPMFYEEDLIMLLPVLLSSIPSAVMGIATYVLSAMALYTVARRRGLNNPWLAWIPVVNCWIVGSLSDQYQYVVKGQNKAKRKILLILSVLTMVFSVTIIVLAVVMAAGAVFAGSEAQIMANIMGPVMGILGMCLPLVGVAIAFAVIRYMAMYDIYRSLDPGNAVLFLVLSIFFNITEPFFLFFNRNKDGGMPPRKQPQSAHTYQEQPLQQEEPAQPEDIYVYQQGPSQQETDLMPETQEKESWDQSDKDYL